MKILVTNDDGITARGIRELAMALSSEAEIYVFAPDSQKSACGHGITMHLPLAVNEVDFPKVTGAWSVSGTPADCVKLGLSILKEQKIDIDFVYSGINHGSNLGTDTLYSGTVSGAIEGVINGIPSFAVSIYSHEPKHFGPSCEMAIEALHTSKGKLDGRTVLNINLPDLPSESIKGVRITTLGAREYEKEFREHINEKGAVQYFYAGQPIVYSGLSNDIDVIALQNEYVSITPLHYDLTNYHWVEKVKSWGFGHKYHKPK
ncbi:MAG: 5'/3'-nucleotidase SurE [Eubacteriales bacterium]|nr:5'/3'-nucleotidase SurE [Eubacteriales bacterium]MDD3349862.1 5'/3'-nucleotidase SurE [Eubacteriales bacterium]